MLRKTTVAQRSVLLAVAAMVALAACGGSSDGGDSGDGKKTGGSDSSKDGTGGTGGKDGDSGTGGESGDKGADGTGPSGNEPERLRLGQAATEPTEVTRDDKTGKFKVAVAKVVQGKPGDLDEAAGSDPDKFKGKVPAWVYMDYTHVGGDAPAEVSTSGDWGVSVQGGDRGRPLIMLMGSLSSTPEDCKEADSYGPFKKGQSETVCQVFVVPEGKKVTEVLLSRGFQAKPTVWSATR